MIGTRLEPGLVEQLGAPRRPAPSIMSDGAMMSPARLGLDGGLALQDRHGLVVGDVAVADHAVMADAR